MKEYKKCKNPQKHNIERSTYGKFGAQLDLTSI